MSLRKHTTAIRIAGITLAGALVIGPTTSFAGLFKRKCEPQCPPPCAWECYGYYPTWWRLWPCECTHPPQPVIGHQGTYGKTAPGAPAATPELLPAPSTAPRPAPASGRGPTSQVNPKPAAKAKAVVNDVPTAPKASPAQAKTTTAASNPGAPGRPVLASKGQQMPVLKQASGTATKDTTKLTPVAKKAAAPAPVLPTVTETPTLTEMSRRAGIEEHEATPAPVKLAPRDFPAPEAPVLPVEERETVEAEADSSAPVLPAPRVPPVPEGSLDNDQETVAPEPQAAPDDSANWRPASRPSAPPVPESKATPKLPTVPVASAPTPPPIVLTEPPGTVRRVSGTSRVPLAPPRPLPPPSSAFTDATLEGSR